ncbi:hypothetical protein RND81_12G145100 [Saponaria officinalis]|uniref:RNase H type-1 domain-containing protein n=1 Tax=Saponaria officinalis TaxID=3572 RepID=A0AAW1HAM3_SAPOF
MNLMTDSRDIAEAFSLIICLQPQDDVPHPRHLCFKYPFTKTSPKRHCSKCYCYVCEEVAPCKKWNKPPHKHCQMTEAEERWRLQKQLRKNLPGTRLTMARHKLTVTAFFEPPGQFVHGFGGALISTDAGDWVRGVSMRIHNNTSDCSFTPYTALLEGLKLSWSQGFRHLDIYLGFLYLDGFWYDFNEDARTKKFRLSVDASCISPQIWALMKDVEDYLNREWFIRVRKCASFKEETDSFGIAVMADCQAETKKVYDFTTHPLTAQIMDIARD